MRDTKTAQPEKSLGRSAGDDAEQACAEGYMACDKGIEKHRNPYLTKDTHMYEWWRRGWEKRYYNEPREKV